MFDGRSFVLDHDGRLVLRARAFDEDSCCVDFFRDAAGRVVARAVGADPVAPELQPEESVYRALVLGVRDYVGKHRFPGVVMGLSGGVDSALTLAIAVDALGADRYAPSGPKHNLSAASDRSVSLLIDGGTGADTYDLTHSDGLGDADGESWALFIDEGGADRYQGLAGLGHGTQDSLGLFFDLAGTDTYDSPSGTPAATGRGNERTIRTTGSLFQDR